MGDRKFVDPSDVGEAFYRRNPDYQGEDIVERVPMDRAYGPDAAHAEAPSPFELWERAQGDRDEYLRLMREHGHLVPGKREPGTDIFGHPTAIADPTPQGRP